MNMITLDPENNCFEPFIDSINPEEVIDSYISIMGSDKNGDIQYKKEVKNNLRIIKNKNHLEPDEIQQFNI